MVGKGTVGCLGTVFFVVEDLASKNSKSMVQDILKDHTSLFLVQYKRQRSQASYFLGHN